VKIIHAVSGLLISAGGPSRSIPALATALAERGVNVSLLRRHSANEVPFPTGVKDARLDGKAVTIPHNDKIPLTDYLGSSDIVHSHGIWAPFNHQIASHKPKLHIIAPRGMLEPWSLNNSKWKKRLAWWLYQRRDLHNATAFHATALSEAENIRRLGFKQPIAVIPNGIVLPDDAVWRSSFLVPRASLDLDSSSFVVSGSSFGTEDPRFESEEPRTKNQEPTKKTAFFLSRLHPKKGLPMLLEAWARIRPNDWRLVIAGNDEVGHTRELQEKIKQLGLESDVELPGPLFDEAKEQAYLNADLFILPSYSENFGIVVAEALGYGLPVLTTTGCPWQQLETHNCGWWVEPTVASLEAGLQAALGAGSEELRAMGLRGRKLVEQNYQWPGIAERMLEFYGWILNGGTQPTFVV
jgi:glycosyltransferase involved in cell wall biosynthesis